MRKLIRFLMPLAGLAVFISSCAKPSSKCLSPEDNPVHHYVSGMELLEQYKLSEASAKFERALYCDGNYSPADSGMAIVTAFKANMSKPEGYRKADVDKTFDYLDHAHRSSSSREDEFAYRLASMRVHTTLKDKKWLPAVEDSYKDAMKLKVDEKKLPYYEGREAATYFMGEAYLNAGDFQQARDAFKDVINQRAESRWSAPADREWKRTDKIVRAIAGVTVGDTGKAIATRYSVKRGEMTALFSDELNIDKLFAGRIPVKSETENLKPDYIPADIQDSPFKNDIVTLMKWRIRGLEPFYESASRAYLFKPEDAVTRKEFALALEDILIKLTGDETMARAFMGHEKSPFPDVPATAAWYNAAINVTTRNIMETELSGEFRPNDNVDGAEAILAIRMLKQKLNIH